MNISNNPDEEDNSCLETLILGIVRAIVGLIAWPFYGGKKTYKQVVNLIWTRYVAFGIISIFSFILFIKFISYMHNCSGR